MSAAYPIEALLRPPVELYSAAVSAAAACATALAPDAFMMIPEVAYATSAVLGVFAVVRANEGLGVLRFQRNLKRVPHYEMRASKIPYSHKRLFLGRGFLWTQKHTQRLRAAFSPDAEIYLRPSAAYQWARRKEVEWEHLPVLRHLAEGLSRDTWWNPLRPLPDVGGKAALHGVEPDEEDVYMNLSERVGHTLVLGATRVGKTRLEEVLVSQDIRRGDIVVVFDPKGDADLLRRVYTEAQRAGRLDELYIFHLGFPEISARYNTIGSFSRITEVASRLTGPLPDSGNAAAFKEFSWRFANAIACAVVALGQRPDIHVFKRYISNIEPLFVQYTEFWLSNNGPADWRAKVQKLEGEVKDSKELKFTYKGRGYHAIALAQYLITHDIYDPIADSLRGAFTYDRTFFDKLVASLLPLLEKLTTGSIDELLVPDYTNTDDPRPILDWMNVIRRRGIVYVGFDALTDPVVCAAVGASMFSDITSGLGHIYKNTVDFGLPTLNGGLQKTRQLPKICVHADEFNEIIGEEFIPMLNKGGGAGLCVTAYTQTSGDIEARVGSLARAEQVMGNFNTLVMLRVKNQKTAEVLTTQLREVDVSTLVEVSGASDSSDIGDGVDFTSRNEDRISVLQVPTLVPADIMSLPKGQAFVLTEGATLRKIRMPLPARDDDADLPPTLESMAKAMEKRYTTGEQWWSQRVGSVTGFQTKRQASAPLAPFAHPVAMHVEERTAQWTDGTDGAGALYAQDDRDPTDALDVAVNAEDDA
jgi:conjugative coupling factor TraD (TOL family)